MCTNTRMTICVCKVIADVSAGDVCAYTYTKCVCRHLYICTCINILKDFVFWLNLVFSFPIIAHFGFSLEWKCPTVCLLFMTWQELREF